MCPADRFPDLTTRKGHLGAIQDDVYAEVQRMERERWAILYLHYVDLKKAATAVVRLSIQVWRLYQGIHPRLMLRR